MTQVTAAFNKTLKVLLREKGVLFWTIAWPSIWVLIDSFAFVGGASKSAIPKDVIAHMRGSITISMMVFALTIAGMANLPGNIATDKESGLLAKLRSMPISAWKDFIGRIMGLVTFSCLAAAIVTAIGLACGASLSGSGSAVLASIGFLLLILSASAGIGLLIGTFVEHLHGAIMTGVAFAVVTASISGLFAPYEFLPSALQHFARVYPVSSANSSIIYLLVGKDYAGYTPLGAGQLSLMVVLSLLLFTVGVVCYSRFCWRRE